MIERTKITKEQRSQLIEWLRDNRQNFDTDTECFRRAVVMLGLSLKVTSSAVTRYFAKVNPTPTVEPSPLDQIRDAERQIQDALRGLEAERDRLHCRIVEIDNTVAKYRKISSNGVH